jgi:hypothetical protein
MNPVITLGITLGGVLSLVGWLLIGFSMIFVWVFGAQSEAFALMDFRGPIMPAQGKVLAESQTSMSEGGSDHNPGTPIYEYDFEYTLSTGMTRQDKCYTLGGQYKIGQDVEVEYVQGPPPRARIKGSRLAPFESWILFVLIFPLIGLILVVTSYTMGLRTLALIKRGKLASGKLIGTERTNTKINNQTVYKLTFEFTDDKGATHRATVRTHQTHLVEDQPEERLFYDPQNPTKARMVDLLPRGLTVGADGSIIAGAPVFMLISAFVVPALVIGVHALVGWVVLT